MHGLVNNVEIRIVGSSVSAGSSIDNNSSRIDMADYESVSFIAAITDSVATGVATLTIEENDTDADSGMTAVSGSPATVTCAVNDDINDQALVSEVFKPSKRYVQAVRSSATANIAYGPLVALLTPRRKPATQGTTVAASTTVAN